MFTKKECVHIHIHMRIYTYSYACTIHTYSKIVMDEDIKMSEICLKLTQEDKKWMGV